MTYLECGTGGLCVMLMSCDSLDFQQADQFYLPLCSDWCWKCCSSERETSKKQWLTITCHTQMHAMRVNLHKETRKPNLLCDRSEVNIFSCCGETSELVFIFRAQESDGGQSDVCFLKVLLDLLCILCVTDREGGGRIIILQMMRYGCAKIKNFNICLMPIKLF